MAGDGTRVMPARRKHLEADLLFSRMYNLNLKIEDLILIEALIDEPARHATLIIKLVKHRGCSSTLLNNLVNSYMAGLRFNGVFSHDWRLNRYTRGRQPLILKWLVSCIFGDEATLIIDLHSSLDMIYSSRFRDRRDYRRWAERNRIDYRVIEFVENIWVSGALHDERTGYKGKV